MGNLPLWMDLLFPEHDWERQYEPEKFSKVSLRASAENQWTSGSRNACSRLASQFELTAPAKTKPLFLPGKT
jgi:hypothetical protein